MERAGEEGEAIAADGPGRGVEDEAACDDASAAQVSAYEGGAGGAGVASSGTLTSCWMGGSFSSAALVIIVFLRIHLNEPVEGTKWDAESANSVCRRGGSVFTSNSACGRRGSASIAVVVRGGRWDGGS